MNAARHRREVHLRAVGIRPPETAVADPAFDVEGARVLVSVEEAPARALVSDGLVQKVLKRVKLWL